MLAWSLPAVSAAAGGLAPFDMRLGGYSFPDAQRFLAALDGEGLWLYQNVQHLLDLFYPPLASLTLFCATGALLPARLGGWRWVIAAVALPTWAVDYLENAIVGEMLRLGAAAITPALVEQASSWTVLKSQLTTISMSIVLLLLMVRGGQRLLRRRRGAASV